MNKRRAFFALLMATGLMALSPARALAEDLPELFLGENSVDVIGATGNDERSSTEGYNLYTFMAPGSGMLEVSACGNGDSYGALFDASGTFLVKDDDSNDNLDFVFRWTVTEGEMYYIGLRGYEPDAELHDYTITLGFVTACPVEVRAALRSWRDYSLPDYVYATLAETGEAVPEEVPFGTQVKLHADEIPGLVFDYWLFNGTEEEDPEIEIEADLWMACLPVVAYYRAAEGKIAVELFDCDDSGAAIWHEESGLPFIVAEEGETVTIGYSSGFDLDYCFFIDEEDNNLAAEVDVDSENSQLSFTLPSNLSRIDLYLLPPPGVPELYGFDYGSDFSFMTRVFDLEEAGEREFTGCIYIDAEEYDNLEITYLNASDYEYSDYVCEDGVLTLTLYDYKDQPYVYRLQMVKGRFFELFYNENRCELSHSEECIVLDEWADVEAVFVTEGAEGKITALTVDPEEYHFVRWFAYDDENQEGLTDPVLTLNGSSFRKWQAVFTSESFAEISITSFPEGVYSWITDASGKKIYDMEGYTEFDEEGNPDTDSWTYPLVVPKGTEITLHFDEEESGYTFRYWEDDDGMVSDDAEAVITVSGDAYYAGLFKRTVSTRNGWMTYCDGGSNYTIEGGKAYKAEYQPADGAQPACVVLTSTDDVIAWGDAILISSEAGTVDILYGSDGADRLEGNLMVGNYSDSDWTFEYSPYQFMAKYGLYNQEADNICFRRYTGNVLPAHKAVLIPESLGGMAPSVSRLGVIVDGEELGIIEVAADEDPFDAIFDLMGRRGDDDAKGLMIMNGKTVWNR